MKKGGYVIIFLLVVLAIVAGLVLFLKRREEEAAKVENFLGTNNKRGIRNNNLGNIILIPAVWKGEVPPSQNTDGKFKQFVNMPIGTAQFIAQVQRYFSYGRNTISEIIGSWDLGNQSYIEFLSKYTGFAPNQILTPDKETLRKLIKGITRFENGYDFLTDARFNAGWEKLNEI